MVFNDSQVNTTGVTDVNTMSKTVCIYQLKES